MTHIRQIFIEALSQHGILVSHYTQFMGQVKRCHDGDSIRAADSPGISDFAHFLIKFLG